MRDETVLLNKFKLDRYSPLVEDALLLNIDLKKYRQAKAPLLQATILGLFENRKELVIFFYLPEAGQYLSEIVINQQRYGVQIHDEDGFVHKYVIPTPFKPGRLKVSEYIFVDDSLKKTTFAVQEEHVFGLLKDQYFYDSKRYFQTQLEGELLYDVIDMTTVQNKIEDLLGRTLLYRDISSLKSKSVKLYYVAFNLFDPHQQKYFVPEDIVEMKVAYQESRYVFQAKKVENPHEVDPQVDGDRFAFQRRETIAKEARTIESGERSAWNILQNFFTYKQYRYHSIYKITDKIKVKDKRASGFSYVLVVGPQHGYRLSQATLKRGSKVDFDFEETTLSHILIDHLTYQERGHRYAIPVQSLVYETDKKSRLPRVRNRIRTFLRSVIKAIAKPLKFIFGASGILFKIMKWMVKHWKLILILVILGLLIYLGNQVVGLFR